MKKAIKIRPKPSCFEILPLCVRSLLFLSPRHRSGEGRKKSLNQEECRKENKEGLKEEDEEEEKKRGIRASPFEKVHASKWEEGRRRKSKRDKGNEISSFFCDKFSGLTQHYNYIHREILMLILGQAAGCAETPVGF